MNVSLRRISQPGARAVRAVVLVLLLAQTACLGPRTGLAGGSAFMSAANDSSNSGNSGNSGNSSGNSGNSSGNSGNSSGNSGNSSGNSANSSNQSSANSNQSTPKNSSAQSAIQSSEQSTQQSSQSTVNASVPIASTVIVGTTVVGVGVLIWFGVAATAKAGAAAAAGAAPAAQLFLRANSRQLEQDLALGAGRSIEDLAAVAEIRPENLSRFGRLLREHRAELLALARPSTLTPERAMEFMKQVGGLARADATLARDGEAFLAHHPGG